MNEIDQIVTSFAEKIAALLQQQMRAALAGNAKPVRGKVAASPKRRAGEKRPQEDLERLRDRGLRVIGDNPGKRVEELNVALGTNARELALPLKQLIAAKRVKTQGQRRGTRYFATGKA